MRVLAIASGGGHWVQLLRLRAAWEGCACVYAVTRPGYEKDLRDSESAATPKLYVLADANLTQKTRLIMQLLQVVRILLRERPDVIITTGASVGYFAIRFGKLIGARTIWVDSIANAEELSLSGQRAGKYADLWLTQWPELAKAAGSAEQGPRFVGSVI